MESSKKWNIITFVMFTILVFSLGLVIGHNSTGLTVSLPSFVL